MRDMSQHVIGAGAQWDIQGPDGESVYSVTSRTGSETNLLYKSSETVFGDFM